MKASLRGLLAILNEEAVVLSTCRDAAGELAPPSEIPGEKS
jgi:hypothetical protein